MFHLIAVWAIGIAPFAHAQTDASGGWPLAAHIVFSIVAFLLFAQAAVLALAVTWKEGQIRSGQVSSLAQKLPSILMLEHGLFTSIKVGFVTLTLSIFSGMIFIRDISAQHLTHKTVL
ncbi:MAG: cytochrome c biogenesis protein CcsA, partial [Pseudomonadota bacterium]